MVGSRLAHALADLTRTRASTSVTADLLSEISVICQGAFSQPAAVSISLGDPSAPTLVATASKLAQSLDGAQMMAGEGPLHLAWERRDLVHTSNLPQDPRWPRLARRVADSSVCAAISTPLDAGESPTGALSVYSVFPELVNDAALETVELLASTIATVIDQARAKQELESVAAQLQRALGSRATIDQAKGILMARHGCDADRAFELLVQASTSTNIKLREVAERLVRDTVVDG